MKLEIEFVELHTPEEVAATFTAHPNSTGLVLVREFLHPETREPVVAYLLGGDPGEPAMGFVAPFSLAGESEPVEYTPEQKYDYLIG